jgi:glucan phosphoethanolaminetransferase (alkaline phosphatase superfamily)
MILHKPHKIEKIWYAVLLLLLLLVVVVVVVVVFNWNANGFLPGGSGTTIRHITQSYTYNKTNEKMQEKKKLSFKEAVEAYRVVGCRGSQIV